MSTEEWKFRGHISIKGKGIRQEVKVHEGIELFREIDRKGTIYYVQSDKKNFETEEELLSYLKLKK
jgi:hypothetical protein